MPIKRITDLDPAPELNLPQSYTLIARSDLTTSYKLSLQSLFASLMNSYTHTPAYSSSTANNGLIKFIETLVDARAQENLPIDGLDKDLLYWNDSTNKWDNQAIFTSTIDKITSNPGCLDFGSLFRKFSIKYGTVNKPDTTNLSVTLAGTNLVSFIHSYVSPVDTAYVVGDTNFDKVYLGTLGTDGKLIISGPSNTSLRYVVFGFTA